MHYLMPQFIIVIMTLTAHNNGDEVVINGQKVQLRKLKMVAGFLI